MVKSNHDKYKSYQKAEYQRSQISRLMQIKGQVAKIAAKHVPAMAEQLKTTLASDYEDRYYKTIHQSQTGMGAYSANFARVSEKTLDKIVEQPWADSDYSRRLWREYTDTLPGILEKHLTRAEALGLSTKRVVDELQSVLKDRSRSDIHRLVITERSHMTAQGTLAGYKERGTKKYEYIATLETKTCDECQRLDGKIFDVSEAVAGTNYPNIHPHCRCITAPWHEAITSDDDITRWSKNPNTNRAQ